VEPATGGESAGEVRSLQRAQAEIVQSEKLASLGVPVGRHGTRDQEPAQFINLFAQLLKAGIDDPEKQGYLDKILKEVDRIDDIMRKLLDASKRPRFS